MSRSIRTRIARYLIIAGIIATAAVGAGGVAFAEQTASGTILPGNQLCTAAQHANIQVRGFGTASGTLPQGGAKFKLLRNGVVVNNTAQRVLGATLQFLPPTFPGPGDYQMCANNTGSSPVSVTLDLKTDGEVH